MSDARETRACPQCGLAMMIVSDGGPGTQPLVDKCVCCDLRIPRKPAECPPAESAVRAANAIVHAIIAKKLNVDYGDNSGERALRDGMARIIEAEAPPAQVWFAGQATADKLRECEQALERTLHAVKMHAPHGTETSVIAQAEAALKSLREGK